MGNILKKIINKNYCLGLSNSLYGATGPVSSCDVECCLVMETYFVLTYIIFHIDCGTNKHVLLEHPMYYQHMG